MKITLATLPQATAQQVFDQVAVHLLTQMRRSEGFDIQGNRRCLYRSEVGMCAAGCIIDDGEYKMELDTVDDTGWLALSDRGLVPCNHVDLIVDLQCVHDSNLPEKWAEELALCAHQHGLSPAVVTNFKVQQ